MALALLPPILTMVGLWIWPVGQLAANRAALAARDYTVMWAAGHLAWLGKGGLFFDLAGFNSALRAIFGAGIPWQIWPYPPPMLLLAVPLSTLPLLPSFLLYTCSTVALLWAALRSGSMTRAACCAVLISPAVAENALAGQNAALTGALLLSGLLIVDRRPILAGAILGLLVIKPQLGLLLPVCLIASGNWRALLAMAISASLLMGLSGAFFGLDAWVGFFVRTPPLTAALLEAPWQASPSQLIFASPLMAARSVGASLQTAYGLQGVVTLACAAVAWQTWRVPRVDPLLRAAFTGLLALAAAPWVHTYDMILMAVTIALLSGTTSLWSRILLAFAWTWPGAALMFAIPLPLSLVSLAAVAWLAWRQLRHTGNGSLPEHNIASPATAQQPGAR